MNKFQKDMVEKLNNFSNKIKKMSPEAVSVRVEASVNKSNDYGVKGLREMLLLFRDSIKRTI